jgi:putative DNA primase/helicase
VGDVVERARERWREILPQLGIAPSFLVNKHGPCPLCGGRDRFRYDDREGTGSYYCGQCGAGVAIILIRKLHGWDHATACRAVDEIIGRGSPAPHSRPKRPPDRGAAIRRLLGAANQPAIVVCASPRRSCAVTRAAHTTTIAEPWSGSSRR